MIGDGLLEGEVTGSVGSDVGEAVAFVGVNVVVLSGLALIAALVGIMTVGVGETAAESSKMRPAAPIQANRPTASTPITL